MTRCGTVAIVGLPNVGKSTLLNQLVGQHLAFTSPRPQSTRRAITGVRSSEHAQAIFVDTPGILTPGYHLHHALLAVVDDALRHADVVIHLQEQASAPAIDRDYLAAASIDPRRVIEVLNKQDLATSRAPGASDGPLRISARTGEGIDVLWEEIARRLPEGPFRHDPDDLSTMPLRFFVGEAVREAAFTQLKEELPYAIHCEVEEFREAQVPVYIRVSLFVERESQKRIVIGAGGRQLRDLGAAARHRLEELVGQPVYLDLWVKVLKDWRRNAAMLGTLGFTLPREARR